ncbi:AMP-binding protein [Actinomadura oligospora]|uniref:AMP-binding protein n=1 Tax=Actinomadura oligospora TaxID=111804 RepID=UPI00047DC9A0|nr:AMP-binding protein [Actinomadura oligospora]
MSPIASLAERVGEHAGKAPSRIAVVDVEGPGRGDPAGLTYAELDAAGRVRAAWLSGHCSPGDRVLLLYSTGTEMLKSLLGCLRAGVIAVVAPVPGPARHLSSATGMALDAEPRVVLTDAADLVAVSDWAAQDGLPRMTLLMTGGPGDHRALVESGTVQAEFENGVTEFGDGVAGLGSVPQDAVALQWYVPRPGAGPERVSCTHAEMARRLDDTARAMELTAGVRSGAWLPMWSGGTAMRQVLATLYAGGTAITVSPDEPMPPRHWLELIDRHRVEVSGAPARFYDECVRGVPDEWIDRLDLSCWRLALIEAGQAAEGAPARFAARFARAGFRPGAFAVGYSPAPWVSLVSTSPALVQAEVRTLEHGVLRPLRSGTLGATGPTTGSADADAVSLVGLEIPPGLTLDVVDPRTGETLADLRVGEIEIPSRDGLGRERTGDLGVRHAGRVHLVGRSHETLSAYGRTLYPGIVERRVRGLHRAFEGMAGGVFTVPAPHGRLVVVHEFRQGGDEEFCLPALTRTIRDALAHRLGAQAGNVVLLRAGDVPRTLDGGVDRALLRDLFMADALAPLHEELDPEVRRRYRRELPARPVRLHRSRARRTARSVR